MRWRRAFRPRAQFDSAAVTAAPIAYAALGLKGATADWVRRAGGQSICIFPERNRYPLVTPGNPTSYASYA